MKEVSLREFQLKASQYLDKLPIILTRYNKPVAFVIKPTVDTNVSTPQKSVVTSQESVNTRYGYCEQHFEKGVQYQLTQVRFTDSNGDSEEKWVCPSCLKSMERFAKEKGGKVERM